MPTINRPDGKGPQPYPNPIPIHREPSIPNPLQGNPWDSMTDKEIEDGACPARAQTLADRICEAEFEALDVNDLAAVNMLGDICREFAAGNVSEGHAEIALAGWAKRRDETKGTK